MRTSVTLTRWLASVSSWTSPRMQDFAQHMAHLLADAEQADRTAFGGFTCAHQLSSPMLPARAGGEGAAGDQVARFVEQLGLGKAMVLPRLITRPLPTNGPDWLPS